MSFPPLSHLTRVSLTHASGVETFQRLHLYSSHLTWSTSPEASLQNKEEILDPTPGCETEKVQKPGMELITMPSLAGAKTTCRAFSSRLGKA